MMKLKADEAIKMLLLPPAFLFPLDKNRINMMNKNV